MWPPATPNLRGSKDVVEPLSLQTIAQFAGGAVRQGDLDQVVTGISTDSRNLGAGALFLALRGERIDAHSFVETAAARGAVGAIVSSPVESAGLPKGFALIDVADTLLAYQRIAAHYRRTMPMKLVAITGSNGKTSTKDLTAAILSGRYRVLKTSGNFNNHVGVPITLLRAAPADEYAVLEIGMNHPGEIAPLAKIAAPDVAVITNIGTAHIEFMRTREAIAEEKGALVEAVNQSGCVILSAEDEFTSSISKRAAAAVITVGFSGGDYRAENVLPGGAGTTFTVRSDHGSIEAHLRVPGRHMVLNSLLAMAVGQTAGISLADCAANLERLDLTKGRLEFKEVAGLQILDDSYNANPDSVVAAIETLAELPVKGRRIAVLGRMGELGTESEAGHRRIGAAAAKARLDQLIAVGAEAEHVVDGARRGGLRDAQAVATLEEAARRISGLARPEDLVLLKGSRSAGMERILGLLDPENLPATATH